MRHLKGTASQYGLADPFEEIVPSGFANNISDTERNSHCNNINNGEDLLLKTNKHVSCYRYQKNILNDTILSAETFSRDAKHQK